MSNQRDYDISNVQVPDSLIQEILEQTEPLEEVREEIHPSQPQAQTKISEQGEVVKLLSLLFEEFDKLNARLDKIQESVKEMTTVGTIGTGYSGNNGRSYEVTPETPEDAQSELEGKKRIAKADALTKLLKKRLSR